MIDFVIEQIKTNPYVMPVIVACFSAIISGAVFYILRDVPAKVLSFLRRQLTTTIEIENGNWEQLRIYNFVLEMCSEYRVKFFTRVWQIFTNPADSSKPALAIGTGGTILRFNGKLVLYHLIEENVPGFNQGKFKRVSLTYMGRNLETGTELLKLIDVAMSTADNKYAANHLNLVKVKQERQSVFIRKIFRDSLAVNPEFIGALNSKLDNFINNYDDYIKLGIPHKLTMLFHGVPGTGKTTLANYIASRLNYRLCVFSQGSTFAQLEEALAVSHGKAVVLFDDIDTMEFISNRSISNNDVPFNVKDNKPENINQSGGLATLDDYSKAYSKNLLGSFLSFLGGIIPLEDVVIVMTTNCIEKFDAAILRDARLDISMEVEIPRAEVIKEYFEKFYGGLPELDGKWTAIKPASIYQIKERALLDRNKVIDLILNYGGGSVNTSL